MSPKRSKKNRMIPDSIVRHSATWRGVLIKSFFSALLAIFVLLLFAVPISRLTQYLQGKFINEQKVQAQLVERLQAYADENRLSVSDIENVSVWEKETHMQIRILGNDEELKRQRDFAEKYGRGILRNQEDREALKHALSITLSDGTLWVRLQKNPVPWYRRANILILFLLLILVYAIGMLFLMRDEIEYMIYLRDEINRMSGGDLTHEIRGFGNTEIGQIGEGINELRKSIAGQIQKEHEALTANRELVTAMSHDLRTPLTRQIGYLEILHLKKYESESQRDSYILKARSNAFLMKETTDKLFRYFLAFGKSDQSSRILEVNGALLFNHAIREQTDYLKSQQFTVSFAPIEGEFWLKLDPDEFARVFDNVFQNIKKYGDTGKTVTIDYLTKEGFFILRIRNGIKEDISKVESTGIGLKIVKRIMKETGGNMSVSDDGRIYEIRLAFLLLQKKGA